MKFVKKIFVFSSILYFLFSLQLSNSQWMSLVILSILSYLSYSLQLKLDSPWKHVRLNVATGQIAMIKFIGDTQGIQLEKYDDNVHLLSMVDLSLTVGETYPVEIELWKSQIKIEGTATKCNLVKLNINDDFMNKLKNSFKFEELKIVVYDKNGGRVNLITKLEGFKYAYDKVKKTKY